MSKSAIEAMRADIEGMRDDLRAIRGAKPMASLAPDVHQAIRNMLAATQLWIASLDELADVCERHELDPDGILKR